MALNLGTVADLNGTQSVESGDDPSSPDTKPLKTIASMIGLSGIRDDDRSPQVYLPLFSITFLT